MFESNPSVDRIEQIDAMRMGVDYRFNIKCRSYSFSCRPLSIGEQVELAAKIAERLSTLTPFQRQRLTEHTMYAQEVLAMASTSEKGKYDPKITTHILDSVTPDELQYLYKQYCVETDRVNPALEMLKPEDVKTLVEQVKKTPPEDLVSVVTELSFLELASMCCHFLQVSSPTDK